MPFHPPAGYQSVPSAIEGISVYAPIPKTEPVAAPVGYHCPQCGAPTQYDVSAGGIACQHCGYQAPVQAAVVGRAAPTAEFTLETLAQAQPPAQDERPHLHCQACGAELELPADALAATCPFCGSNQVNLSRAPGEHFRPGHLIPFQIPPDECRRRAQAWLGRGWYHPAALAAAADRPWSGIYLPFWTFSARIAAQWQAEVGYEHRRKYFDRRALRWRSRLEIEWRPESGPYANAYTDLPVPGSRRLNPALLARVAAFRLEALSACTPDYLAGWQAQIYDIPLETAWAEGKARMREQFKLDCRRSIPSKHVRNLSLVADFQDESWRLVLLPVYLLTYPYRGRIFQVLVNGQTGQIAGQKPVEWKKVAWACAALLLPALLAGLAAAIYRASVPGLAGLALILLVVGLLAAFLLYQRAAAAEEGG